jgi:hypothetical protein
MASENYRSRRAPASGTLLRTTREEQCLSRLILFGEHSLQRALQQYVVHYHEERNHQGKDYLILFSLKTEGARNGKAAVRCRERLGGLLKYYEREAA